MVVVLPVVVTEVVVLFCCSNCRCSHVDVGVVTAVVVVVFVVDIVVVVIDLVVVVA